MIFVAIRKAISLASLLAAAPVALVVKWEQVLWRALRQFFSLQLVPAPTIFKQSQKLIEACQTVLLNVAAYGLHMKHHFGETSSRKCSCCCSVHVVHSGYLPKLSSNVVVWPLGLILFITFFRYMLHALLKMWTSTYFRCGEQVCLVTYSSLALCWGVWGRLQSWGAVYGWNSLWIKSCRTKISP